MNRNKAFLFLPLLAALALSSCSGLKGGGCVANCTAATGSLSVTLVSDTLPANPSLLSYKVTVTGISLTTSGGSQQSVTLTNQPVIDLVRSEADSAFVGTFTDIPAGQYTGITLSLSNPEVDFFNDTASTITNVTPTCASGSICTTTGASAVPAASLSFSISANGVTGIGFDVDLANSISLTATSLINLSATSVASAFTLPRTGSNLASGKFDLIEDFTGVLTLSGNTATIVSPARGTLTATGTANTILNPNPGNTLCLTPTLGTLSTCVSSGQVVSADILLNSDGTLSLQEIEPLLAAQEDLIEGLVAFLPGNQTQFGIIVTDIPANASSNSLITGQINVGDPLTLTLSNANGFLVDSKGLSVASNSAYNNFFGATTADALHFGQVVTIHATSFTAATSSTDALANTDTVILRWSRFIATPTTASSTLLSVDSLPTYFGLPAASIFGVELFAGTQGTSGVTNLDGITDGASITTTKPVAVRALFLENTNNTASPAFFAAKVRQH